MRGHAAGRGPLDWLLWVAPLLLFATFIPVRWHGDRPFSPVAEGEKSRPDSVWVRFPRGATALDHSALELGEVHHRALAGSSILVIGFAREGSKLDDNLDLAERRAVAVARRLVDLGMVRERIVVAAAESQASDDDDRRCEVRFVTRASGP